LQQQIQAQQSKLAEITQKVATNNSEIDTMNDRIEQLQEEKVRIEQNRHECSEKMKNKDNIYHDTRTRMQQLSLTIQKLQQKLKVLDERDQQVMKQISTVEKELSNKIKAAEQHRLRLNENKERSAQVQSARLLAEKCMKDTKIMNEGVQRKLEQNEDHFTASEQIFKRLNMEINQSNGQLGNNEHKRVEVLRKLQQYEKTMTDIQIHYFQVNSKLEQLSYKMIHEDIQQRPNHKWNEARRNAHENQQSHLVNMHHQQKQYK
jgi:chromosome segregation ATPase